MIGLRQMAAVWIASLVTNVGWPQVYVSHLGDVLNPCTMTANTDICKVFYGISTWMRLSTCRQVVWCSERGMSQWDQEDSASGNLFLCWHRVARAAQRLERPPATQPDSPTALMTIFGHTGHPRLPLVESMVGLPAGGPVLIQAPRPVKVDSVVWGWTSRRRYPISRTNNRGRANS